jgi:uncharacterized protein YunC (DUF1805 family)
MKGKKVKRQSHTEIYRTDLVDRMTAQQEKLETMTADEIADFLKINISTVYKLCKALSISYVKRQGKHLLHDWERMARAHGYKSEVDMLRANIKIKSDLAKALGVDMETLRNRYVKYKLLAGNYCLKYIPPEEPVPQLTRKWYCVNCDKELTGPDRFRCPECRKKTPDVSDAYLYC